MNIQEQIDKNRRSVAFDSYDITIRQLFDMIKDEQIEIAPAYQRHFIWDKIRQSQLIESLILGIPVPNLFMATNKDSTWEVIDGLQRLTTIINFIGNDSIIEKINTTTEKLKLKGLEKLTSINNNYFDDLPKSVQLMFLTRPIRVTVLNDRSDFEVRYDLFERLNTGGVTLHSQEIRNCVYLGKFKDFITELSNLESFKSVVKMTSNSERTGNREELVLKFFGYLFNREKFVHSVKGFLNDYMEEMTIKFNKKEEFKRIFEETFNFLNNNLPNGIVRGSRKNITPLILFEAISIGVAEMIIREEKDNIKINKLVECLDDSNLKNLTTGATNSRVKLNSRIDYVINQIS